MGRSPCCDKVGLKKGSWTPEEDHKLLAYIQQHGHGSWRALPSRAGLQRCGKSCRLRWINYLRPDIKRGKFTLQEEQTIIQLHALLGNRWSAIATHLPKRTDNEIKNYWNTHLKKRLSKMGIDPVTHKTKTDALMLSTDSHSKSVTANLSHMAQWESARLEAEARLVRESKLRSNNSLIQQLSNPNFPSNSTSSPHIVKAWSNGPGINGGHQVLESPTSTLSFLNIPMIEFVGSNSSSSEVIGVKDDGEQENWKGFGNSTQLQEYKEVTENSMCSPLFDSDSSPLIVAFLSNTTKVAASASAMTTLPVEGVDHVRNNHVADHEEGFTNLLLSICDDQDGSLSEGGGESDQNGSGTDHDQNYVDNKNYWNSILNLVNSPDPADSPIL